MLDVSVILVSWNTRDLVMACLRSLSAACVGLSWEAIVVDNSSSDGTVTSIHNEFPDVRVIVNPSNVGFAAANNIGIRASAGRYVLLLNSDTIAYAGSIAHMVCFADAHPRAGVIGPRLLNTDGSFQPSCADLPTAGIEILCVTSVGERLLRTGYPGFAESDCQRPFTPGYVSGACLLVRREAVDQVGLMTEDYFMYGEEVDWCWRMWRHKWEIWHDPDAFILHHGGQSTRQVKAGMIVVLYRSKVEVLSRFRGQTHAHLLRIAVFVVWRIKWLLALMRGGDPGVPKIRWADLR